MVEYKNSNLDATFSALSDPTRRAILARLATGNLTVSELAKPFDMSLAAVSKHLGVLARAELISQHKEGRIRRCQLEPQTLKAATQWVEYYKQFWDQKFDSLDRYVADIENQENDAKSSNEREDL